MNKTAFTALFCLAISVGMLSTSVCHAQTMSDILDALPGTVRDVVAPFVPPSDPLDDETTDWGDGTSDEGRDPIEEVLDPLLPPSDPLDDPPDGFEEDGDKNPIVPPDDPLDDPPDGYEDDGKKNPFRPPTDPLDDPPDMGDDLPPSPEYEELQKKMREMIDKTMDKMEASVREELEELRQDHLDELKRINEDYNRSLREMHQGRKDVCKQYKLSQAKRDKLYKTRQADETYYWNMVDSMTDQKIVKAMGTYAQGSKTTPAQQKTHFVELVDLQREKDRLTLVYYQMLRRHAAEKKVWYSANAADDFKCTKARCRQSKSSCPGIGREYQSNLRNINESYQQEIAALDQSIRQQQDLMEEAERERQKALQEFGKPEKIEDLTPEEQKMLDKLLQKKSGSSPKSPPVLRGNGTKGSSFKPQGTHFNTGH
jgi:hypothetical protein